MKTLFIFISVLVLVSCKPQKQEQITNVKNKTKISVLADPSFVTVTDELAQVYESMNDTIDIQIDTIPEETIIQNLMQDKATLGVVSRAMDTLEVQKLLEKNKKCKAYPIATDAVCFISKAGSKDSLFSQVQLENLLTSNPNAYKIVFNANYSASVNYLSQKLNGKLNQKSSFATQSDAELIEYISKNENSVGVLGSNYFSNLSQEQIQKLSGSIQIIGIKVGSQKFYPFQADIAAHKYPYVRTVYVLNNEHFYGPYSGFKNFIIGTKGQRLILKSGLMPVLMPTRLLNFVKPREK